jgi:prevent-host-death family protein
MKAVSLARNLIPIHEVRARLAACVAQVKRTGRPLILTQRGRAAAVLVSPKMLDEIEDRRILLMKVLEGLRDAEAGRFVDDDEVWARADEMIERAEKRRARTVDRKSHR